jgi:putative ABC transport system permease protein
MLRFFLRAFPKQFRDRHGEDLLAACRDHYGPGFAPRAAFDLLWNGLCARMGAAPASFDEWLERPREEGHRPRRLAQLVRDVRSGTRSLAKSPGFTLAIILTLGLGIGATTAIFSVIDAVLLKPLPYTNGARLVRLVQPGAETDNVGFSPLEVADLRAQTRALDAVVEYHGMQFTLLGGAEAQRVATGVVSWNFFDTFGVKPLLGRTFEESDENASAEPVLVLSYDYWKRVYRGDPGIVGRTFSMNDKTHRVIGVLPPIPQHPDENDVYMPVSACPFRNGHWAHHRTARGLSVFGRMRKGVTVEAARADVAAAMQAWHAQYPEAYPQRQALRSGMALLKDELSRDARPTLIVLLAAALFLLVIVCSNVANLTLARLVRREREMAVRTALGATRLRLLQQLLVEGLLLACAGGAAGLVVAGFGLDALSSFAARFTARASEIRIDGRVLLFALAVTLGTGILLGCLPALPSRANLSGALKEGAGASAGKSRLRARSALIVTQVAVSFSLLIGAGLMLRSLLKLQEVNAGFNPQNVLTARLDLNFTRYNSTEKVRDFTHRLLARLRAEPGIESAAVGGRRPLRDDSPATANFLQEGIDDPSKLPRAEVNLVSSDYFRAMGIPVVSGRALVDADESPDAHTVMVNQSFARRWFAGVDPVGHRLSFDEGKTWSPIVGVAADVKQHGLEAEPAAEVYSNAGASTDLRLVLRTSGPVAGLERMVRETVRAIDPAQPVTDVTTLLEVRREALAPPRLTAVLLGAFALLALFITATGIGGVIAYSVSQRTHELGIRLALGAQPSEVLAMVLRQGMGLVAAGLALGAFGGIALSKAMSGLVFGIAASDPATYVAGAALLAAVGAVACFVPARRAAEVDPMISLRSA